MESWPDGKWHSSVKSSKYETSASALCSGMVIPIDILSMPIGVRTFSRM